MAVAVFVPSANVLVAAEFVPAVPATTLLTVTWALPVFVIKALSAQRAAIVCVALPLVSVDETSGLAADTLRVQAPK